MIIQDAKSDVPRYPKYKHGWAIAERAYTFYVNINEIEAIPTNAHLQIDIFVTQLNQSDLANGLKYEWICQITNNWLNMAYLSIISFHNSSGAVLNNVTIALDDEILLPVVVGNIAT